MERLEFILVQLERLSNLEVFTEKGYESHFLLQTREYVNELESVYKDSVSEAKEALDSDLESAPSALREMIKDIREMMK